jgi:hypothetical protein
LIAQAKRLDQLEDDARRERVQVDQAVPELGDELRNLIDSTVAAGDRPLHCRSVRNVPDALVIQASDHDPTR